MITIDKLTLQLSGLGEEEGRRLARLIAEDLAIVNLPARCPGETGSMRVSVTLTPGASVKTLSQQIIADMLRQLDRTG